MGRARLRGERALQLLRACTRFSRRASAIGALGLAAFVGASASSASRTAFASPANAAALPPPGEFPFVHVGSDLGLGEVGAWAMAQDSVGYLWVATETGVFRYDGRHAVHFGTAEGLPAPYVTQLVIGRGDVVWCVTSQGLARYRSGAWTAMWRESADLGFEAVRRIGVDRAGLLWATTSRGLVRESDSGALAIDRAWPDDGDALFLDRGGAILVGARGVVHVQEADGARRVLSEGLPKERIGSIVRDGGGRIWAAATSGVFVLAPNETRFAPWPGLPTSETLLSLDADARAWFASDAGLFYADERGARQRVTGLANDFIGGTFVDREGSFWALGFGIFRLAGRGLWRVYLRDDGLPQNTIWSVRRAAGALWVGTSQGLARATPNAWVSIDRVPKEPIRSIVATQAGALWLSGPAGRVFRYDPRADTLETFDAARGVPDARTIALALDAEGATWIGTVDGGLVKSHGTGADLRFEAVPLEGGEAGQGAATVRDFLADRAGRFWIASDRGLFVIENGKRRRYTVDDGLLASSTAYLLERRSGEICVGYWLEHGVSCMRVEGDRLTTTAQYDVQGGLASDVVYLLGEDARGRMWICGNAGVDLVEGARIVHFGTLDGLPSFDCDARAFEADDEGDVWIGTSRGLGRFLGAAYTGPPTPPSVALTATHEIRGAARPLGDGAQIPWSERAVDLRFAALSFLHEPAMEYETRMLGGGGGDWKATTSDHMRYDALAPETYEFQVHARHPGGAWGPPALARFVIAPPWWQTTWFRALVVAGLVGAGYIAVRVRSAALARRNRELEAVVRVRTRELAAAQSEVARAEKLSALGRMLAQLSHELNNPMNVVANNVGPLKEYIAELTSMLTAYRARGSALPDGGAELEREWKTKEIDFIVKDSSEALSVIERAAQRVCAIQGDLASFLRGEGAVKTAGDLNADVRETVRMVRHGLPAGVTIEEAYGDLTPVMYDAGRMNQVFLNLLQNAVFAVAGSGTIRVRTWSKREIAHVAIADDGPGIPDDLRDRIFEPFFTTKPVGKGTGLGLSICRQIVVEQHGGSIRLAERGENGEDVTGATFDVALPIDG